MGKVKQQQSNPSAGNDNGDELAGSTLEDYFATHKVGGLVSQHLLNIPTENDVMATEKAEVKEDLKSERKSEQKNYEDDYEAETSPSEVAGMSLSDYLHVKEGGKEEKLVRAGSSRALPPQLAAAPKKNTPKPDVSGMSLDHYLGAVANDKQDAEKKTPPKAKRMGSKSKQTGFSLPQAKATQQSFAVKGSGIIHTNSNSQDVSSDEDNGVSTPSFSLTPFQRRQKRKEKAKAKQQRNAGSGASVSKAILMAEASSSKERKKSSANASAHSHHHSSTSSFQPPLPKLAVSPSIRTLSHKETEDNDDMVEKLPPL
ncbi:hypothetical protein V7S43_014024 [Phytophthora oleae]|uniref:Uncharacterized protein n=1 Tax=Phytophthora oleae TaxID=2107226 RepID=A0ABD3F2I7_9STRA